MDRRACYFENSTSGDYFIMYVEKIYMLLKKSGSQNLTREKIDQTRWKSDFVLGTHKFYECFTSAYNQLLVDLPLQERHLQKH